MTTPEHQRRLAAYFALRAERPADFDGPADGVRIALDGAEIAGIEDTIGKRYAARGMPRDWASVGIAYQDPYLRLVRDAVVFPDGSPGIHHRVLSNTHPSGTAVLPIYDDRLVLIRHFRHPSRRWHWEIPRGAIEPGSDPETTARTEIAEEIGGEIRELVPLGLIYGATSLVSGAVAIYMAKLSRLGAPQLGEGISGIRESGSRKPSS